LRRPETSQDAAQTEEVSDADGEATDGEMTDAHIEEFQSPVKLDTWQWLFEHTENHQPEF
jgi:hypothetical protein